MFFLIITQNIVIEKSLKISFYPRMDVLNTDKIPVNKIFLFARIIFGDYK